jgi:type II secretory pathway pseudopilin PulG
MKRKLAGDTLIEVMFAFAVLSLIASVSFSGALSSYNTSLNAQWRTQASFAAQYEADALLTYRKSLTWESFNNGSSLAGSSVQAFPIDTDFCIVSIPRTSGRLTYWEITTDTTKCSNLTGNLLRGINGPTMSIRATRKDASTINAAIKAQWTGRNSQTETVVNNILLTEQDQ